MVLRGLPGTGGSSHGVTVRGGGWLPAAADCLRPAPTEAGERLLLGVASRLPQVTTRRELSYRRREELGAMPGRRAFDRGAHLLCTVRRLLRAALRLGARLLSPAGAGPRGGVRPRRRDVRGRAGLGAPLSARTRAGAGVVVRDRAPQVERGAAQQPDSGRSSAGARDAADPARRRGDRDPREDRERPGARASRNPAGRAA